MDGYLQQVSREHILPKRRMYEWLFTQTTSGSSTCKVAFEENPSNTGPNQAGLQTVTSTYNSLVNMLCAAIRQPKFSHFGDLDSVCCDDFEPELAALLLLKRRWHQSVTGKVRRSCFVSVGLNQPLCE